MSHYVSITANCIWKINFSPKVNDMVYIYNVYRHTHVISFLTKLNSYFFHCSHPLLTPYVLFILITYTRLVFRLLIHLFVVLLPGAMAAASSLHLSLLLLTYCLINSSTAHQTLQVSEFCLTKCRNHNTSISSSHIGQHKEGWQ